MYPPIDLPLTSQTQEIKELLNESMSIMDPVTNIGCLKKCNGDEDALKSSYTIKNNMDTKEITISKRTSLKLENLVTFDDYNIMATSETISIDNNKNKNSHRTKSLNYISQTSQHNSNEIKFIDDDDDEEKNLNNSDNNLCNDLQDSSLNRNKGRCQSSNRRKINDNNDSDYNDLEKDNDNSNCCNLHDLNNGDIISNYSLHKDDENEPFNENYFICKKMNKLNAKITRVSNAVKNLNQSNEYFDNIDNQHMLSPNEGPLSKRYAEIAQFKNSFGTTPDTKDSSSSTTTSTINKCKAFNNNRIKNNVNNIANDDNNETLNSYIEIIDGLDINNCSNGNLVDNYAHHNFVDGEDAQTLLPNYRTDGLSHDELTESRVTLISSSDGGILAAGETSSDSSSQDSASSPHCDLSLIERLLRTHPVWFLSGIQRAGAVHLLQGKEEGNFVVRASSQPNTMAVSVRLPPNTGPYIEHYLIQSNGGKLSLESSRFKFDSIPSLIAHYAQCCDELPVQLSLPRALRDAKNRQQISSLALLGQEFWRYPMANPKHTNALLPSLIDSFNASGVNPISNSISFCQTNNTNSNGQSAKLNHPQQSELLISTINSGGIGTPSDTTSSLSSFTTSNGQLLLSPESVDSIILTMSPAESNKTGIVGKTSTFKQTIMAQQQHHQHTSQHQYFGKSFAENDGVNIEMEKQIHAFNTNFANAPVEAEIKNVIISPSLGNTCEKRGVRAQRPTPPNTLNLGPVLRTPPAPPPRWSKPPTPISPSVGVDAQQTNNFTVTTTVTFSVDANKSAQIVEVISPMTNASFQTISKRLSPEGECKSQLDTLSSQTSNRWSPQQTNSRDSKQHRQILSPDSLETPTGRNKRNKFKKESKHYQESAILESPSIYCRSALGDKISDYEDLWTSPDSHKSNDKNANVMSSFRPTRIITQRTDVLPETPTITSLDCNLLSPSSSVTSSSNQSPPLSAHSIQTEYPITLKHNTTEILSSINADNTGNTTYDHANMDFMHNEHAYNKQQTQNVVQIDKMEFECNKRTEKETNEHHLQYISSQICNIELQNINDLQTFDHKSSKFEFKENNMLQPRNRLGLVITGSNLIDSSPSNRSSTPHLTPITKRSKQGSPFYAEPADTLLQQKNVILRKLNNRSILISANKRYSEPPKGPIISIPLTQQFEYEKNNISGSLENIKRRQRIVDGRLDPWPLDSSWEFMGTEDPDNDYDSDLNWNDTHHQEKQKPYSGPVSSRLSSDTDDKTIKKELMNSTLTVHQIISKRYPHIKLPEIIKPTLPTDFIESHYPNSVYRTIEKGQRISAYDNINKKKANITASYLNFPDSTQSDDGTVFSEPWDSSQWDSFLPQDNSMNTINFSKCRLAVPLSEDNTLTEENTSTLRSTAQKVATIIRSRSCRDREILCHPRNKSGQSDCAGASIGDYAMQLASDRTTTFARNIEHFISCTKDSREGAPHIVMRNMRQFMSGMKNYLVKHGEGDFQREVQRARSQLKSDEFLNLDSILETVMHKLVVLPLREHLYGLFVDFYVKSGDVQNLIENIRHASMRVPTDFGIRSTVIPPSIEAMRHIALMLSRLQDSELPFEKLELLLAAITSIFESTGCPRGQQLSADDFLPLLVLVVAKCGFFSAEIEAEFMWGLLQPSLLNGEAGYYLTALCSAVHVLKSFTALDNEITKSIDWRSSTLPASSSVLRVIIPDELNGSLQTRTLPVRPHTTTKEVCRIIAHKARITNPQDYGLFKLVDGEETLLLDAECPQDARIAAKGKHCMLAYKRIDAKIAWPTMNSMSSGTLPNY